jgi:hypothetical protein
MNANGRVNISTFLNKIVMIRCFFLNRRFSAKRAVRLSVIPQAATQIVQKSLNFLSQRQGPKKEQPFEVVLAGLKSGSGDRG